MSDIIVSLRGEKHKVDRAFREDGDTEDFYVYESIELRRLINDTTAESLEIIKPGMFVYGLIDELKDSTFEQCCQRLDCLPVFYVLEFLERSSTRKAATTVLDSDDAEALVLQCKTINQIKGGTLKTREGIHKTDLVMNSDPIYVPIDSIVKRMPAIVGIGSAIYGFDKPRRVSHFAEADENFKFDEGGRIFPLHYGKSDVLRSHFGADDPARQFLKDHGEGAVNVKRILPASSLPRAKSRRYIPTGNPRGRPKRALDSGIDDLAEAAASERLADESPPPPTVVVPDSPPLPLSPSFSQAPSVSHTQPSQRSPQAAQSFPPSPKPVQHSPRLVSAPSSPEPSASPPRLMPPLPVVPPPPLVPLSEHSRKQANVVTEICSAPINQVDLTQETWHKFKPALAEYIWRRLRVQCRDEGFFRVSERVRKFFIDLTRERLGGAFGSFVDETLRQKPDLLAMFLSRFPDDLMRVAHHYVMRPIVYRELCALALADGVVMVDDGVLAKARALRYENSLKGLSNGVNE